MPQQNDIPEDDLNDPGDFGEDVPGGKQPFWKRELLFGYSLPWLLGVALLAIASLGYLYGPSLSLMNGTPSAGSFSEVENTLDGAGEGNTFTPPHEPLSAPAPVDAPQPAAPALPGARADNVAMMTDIRDELDARDKKLNDNLTGLKDSVTRLSEAIRRDEAYAIETRNQLAELTRQLAVLEARQSKGDVAKPTAHTASTGKRQSASPVSGMKVMSLENGMAWIKWQGSTWAVREGDALGNVTIRRIDPASRTVVTSGGSLR